MQILKRYWPSIATAAAGLLTFLTPSVQAYAAQHAAYSVPLLTVWGVVLHHLPSPRA